jgi:hypothetical protein
MTPLAESLARSPELFPQGLDLATDSLSFMRLSEADYAKASFLDDRILGPQTPIRRVPFAETASAVGETALHESCFFIFNIGHAGSTLVSRLLGAHSGIFALREPAILRVLAQAASNRDNPKWTGEQFDHRLTILLKLWSRTFRTDQRALVKATSFASELASKILARPYAPKAIFMFVSPESYLATILGAENSPRETQMLAPLRLKRLNDRFRSNYAFESMSMGEIVAMSWACEMAALNAAAQIAGDRIHWLDFDAFLSNPRAALVACFEHLGVRALPDQIKVILAGPDMRRYSKAPEYDYDAQLRADVLNQARSQHGAEITRGLDWLEKSAGRYPTLTGLIGAGRAS